MFSKSTAALPATLAARVFVIAAVRVVLPWSTCPMVPILQCGLVLSNLAFAILNVLLEIIAVLAYFLFSFIHRLFTIIFQIQDIFKPNLPVFMSFIMV